MFFGGIASFILFKIVPAYTKIFEDFDTELPSVTLSLISVSDIVYDFWYLAMPLYFALLAMACLLVAAIHGLGHVEPAGDPAIARGGTTRRRSSTPWRSWPRANGR